MAPRRPVFSGQEVPSMFTKFPSMYSDIDNNKNDPDGPTHCFIHPTSCFHIRPFNGVLPAFCLSVLFSSTDGRATEIEYM